MKKIQQIEGIGEAYQAKLNELGIISVEQFLDICKTKKGRKELAEKSEIAEELILTWTNHADLFRIKGVAGQYSELLEAAGVDTVKELAQRNPENLTTAMEKIRTGRERPKRPTANPTVRAVKMTWPVQSEW